MQMEFTGERYVPELLAAKISYEHWHRYIFASRFCAQKSVLDVACGEGYGTAFIGQSAKKITGIDISQETVTHAKAKYETMNTQFITGNAADMTFEKNEFDVIVSFETLEHLATPDQESFMEKSTHCLKDEGVLIISTPNKKVYSDENNYSNPYHIAEFYKDEFELFLRKYYQQVVIFSQQIVAGSLITQPGENVYNVDHLHLSGNGFLPGISTIRNDMEYFIAVCSQVEVNSISGSIMLDDDNHLINDLSKSQ